jgi:CRISPR-associated endoribonuclease Cas6
MARRKADSSVLNLAANRHWPASTELVGLEFDLLADGAYDLYPQYTIGLHAWFLHQIKDLDTDLSAYLHDDQAEKAFNISGLSGQFTSHSRNLQLQAGKTYQWRICGLSKRVVTGLAKWLRQLPEIVDLKNAPLAIQQVRIFHPATTYKKLAGVEVGSSLSLSFTSPTSFRRKGHHLPLPWPSNVFHSYLRRWNEFSGQSIDQADFLEWVDNYVVIQRHQIQSEKIAAGKRGSVTGFTGAVTYGLSGRAHEQPEYVQLFYTLGHYAPYCGTGHKTTFGLGQTQPGWHLNQTMPELPSVQVLLAERIDELTQVFIATKSGRAATGRGSRQKPGLRCWPGGNWGILCRLSRRIWSCPMRRRRPIAN